MRRDAALMTHLSRRQRAPEAIVDDADHVDELASSIDRRTKEDVWSVGVLVYTMMCGVPPIRTADQRMLGKKLQEGLVEWKEEAWGDEGRQMVKEFVSRMLCVDPEVGVDDQPL